MKRSEFLKSLGLSSAALFIPGGLIKERPVVVYDNYIKGLEYYDFRKVRKGIKEGDKLTLQRETANVYDSFATEVRWNGHKLGYLPAYENIVLANMIDAGVQLHSFVSRMVTGDQQRWALAVEVYAHLILPGEKLMVRGSGKGRADDAQDIYRNGI